MSKQLKVFIGSILNESLGFSFGEPWRYDENASTCIVPIIRISKENRKYLTLAEADKTKIQDTGKIDRALISNFEKMPVFLRMGELLKGDTQNRAVVLSRIIMPKHKAEVMVSCVHASQGIRRGAYFTPSGYSPLKDSHYGISLHTTGKTSQDRSWSMDRYYQIMSSESLAQLENEGFDTRRFLGKRMNPDDLTASRDEYNKAVSKILKEVPLVECQVGMALVDMDGFYFLDCFDLHESWEAVKEAIVGKESLAITKRMKFGKSKMFEFKPENSTVVTKEVLSRGYQERTQHHEKRTETVTLDFGDCIGEAVSLDDEIIHLFITRKEQNILFQ